MTDPRHQPLHTVPNSPDPLRSPEATGPGGDSIDREMYSPQYDPRVPDEVRFREHEAENPEYDQTLEGRAEAAETTPGEELRPKDGTLDPGSAR